MNTNNLYQVDTDGNSMVSLSNLNCVRCELNKVSPKTLSLQASSSNNHVPHHYQHTLSQSNVNFIYTLGSKSLTWNIYTCSSGCNVLPFYALYNAFTFLSQNAYTCTPQVKLFVHLCHSHCFYILNQDFFVRV